MKKLLIGLVIGIIIATSFSAIAKTTLCDFTGWKDIQPLTYSDTAIQNLAIAQKETANANRAIADSLNRIADILERQANKNDN